MDALDRLYEDNVKIWRIKYGPVPRRPFNILEVRAFRQCVGCDSSSNINRHHIANDYLFACLRPDRYARRYLEFRKGDVAVICEACHHEVHLAYSELHMRVLRLVNDRYWQKKRMALTLKDCEKYRRKFIKLFNSWLNKRSKKK